MRPTLRSFVGFCLLVAAACAGVPPPSPVGAQPLDLTIRSEPLLLKLDEPGLRRIGKLIWRGGISMTGNSPSFGGWSDLHVSPDGRTLTTISDLGSWLTAAIDYDSSGNLAGLGHCQDRLAARPRRQASRQQGGCRRRGHGAYARRFLAGLVRAAPPHLALSDARWRAHARSTCPRTSPASRRMAASRR